MTAIKPKPSISLIPVIVLTLTVLLVLGFPSISSAQLSPPMVREAGTVAYNGNLTPAEIALDEYSNAISLDPAAEVKVEVTIHAVKDGKVRVNDLGGLPIPDASHERTLDSVSITIPFNTNDFYSGGHFDEVAFADHMDSQLSRLVAKPGKDKKSDGSRTMSMGDAINQSNCGGYSVETTVTITSSSCHLGNVTNTYQCMSNPTTGGNDWYVVSSVWQSNVDCID